MCDSGEREVSLGLRAGPVHLQPGGTLSGEPSRGLSATHRFEIITDDGTVVGHINLRIGSSRHVTTTAGHIGYEILPQHRGRSYSYHACRALAPFVRQHYRRVVLTVDPENTPSVRVIEKLGAVFIEEVVVPEDDPGYEKGARRKRRYNVGAMINGVVADD